MTDMQDIPKDERPRERLLKDGAGALSTTELVMVLLGVGTAELPVQRMAEEVLSRYRHKTLAQVTAAELKSIRGLKDAKAATILAAVELGRRLQMQTAPERVRVGHPEDAAAYVMPYLRFVREERFGVLLLNRKNAILGFHTLSVGGLAATVVDVGKVFRCAIEYNAAAMILCHNHPSGDPEPSGEDISLTERMVDAGKIMGIDIIDHIIIGDDKFISITEQGVIK
ncbi:DNA repair protein RadC [Selenomonas sp. TAMA-11512]|uniref:RadC family protein n=1 Tax=Selenomonas sp. TAMA-11512 TaxID=3095337 RepID=UPI003091768F|nr:DNA repair protein RadC [Selenomonas sp. TAMA-11512]